MAHTTEAVAAAISDAAVSHDMIIVFGASAVADPDDVIPTAIRRAGGVVEHVGMPVDPGNLLVLGRLGIFRSWVLPDVHEARRENGFDWILDRLSRASGEQMPILPGSARRVAQGNPDASAAPGRHRRQAARSVGIVVLAAGQASRMGPDGPTTACGVRRHAARAPVVETAIAAVRAE